MLHSSSRELNITFIEFSEAGNKQHSLLGINYGKDRIHGIHSFIHSGLSTFDRSLHGGTVTPSKHGLEVDLGEAFVTPGR
jgi:hypothetical protein